mmetsp:Transcript_4475/g.8907  ORF Transcript_4475/g.8907 Transcript_4475/m.8907 type:complete len:325 (-) Transcript_4475:1395-2369(-)
MEEMSVLEDPLGADEGIQVGEVDAHLQGRPVLLVKMPMFLLDFFRSQAQRGAPLGTLRMPEDDLVDELSEDDGGSAGAADGHGVKERTTGKGQTAIIELPRGEETKNIPQQYDLRGTPGLPSLQIFSNDPEDDTGKVVAEGFVSHQYLAKAPQDDKYNQLKRMKIENSLRAHRTTGFMNDADLRETQAAIYRPQAMRETAEQREERKNKTLRRVIEMPEAEWREKVMNKLFEIFAKRPYWKFKEIMQELPDEPRQKTKTLVNELCIYHKKGPFYEHHELKDEFKTAQQRQRKEEELAEREAERQQKLLERQELQSRFERRSNTG